MYTNTEISNKILLNTVGKKTDIESKNNILLLPKYFFNIFSKEITNMLLRLIKV